MRQINCVRSKWILEVTHALLIANATSLAIIALATRLVQVVVCSGGARNGEGLGHDGGLGGHGSEATIFMITTERVPLP